jgi:hypothetical protein
MSEQKSENFIDLDQEKRDKLRLDQEEAQLFAQEQLGKAEARGGGYQSPEAPKPAPDVPGITRPEVQTEPMIKDVNDLNGSLARGVEAVESDLEKVLSDKIYAGGPETWTNMISELQEKSKEE